ncbi:uncharacterized protein LOC135961484 [Calliphora vicina]|uniref:uncharacterized protein LOC135961484 n=1 Tax=Calliphora vicina TaxID=7373 RepID=UPI00325B6324
MPCQRVKRVFADLNITKYPGIPTLEAVFLFSTLYRAVKFTVCWKVTNVTPIPKKEEATNPENYRPIANCSALSKVKERTIIYHVVKYLLNDRNYEFHRGRSREDLLALLWEKWCHSIHRFGETKVVALDISKAFD